MRALAVLLLSTSGPAWAEPRLLAGPVLGLTSPAPQNVHLGTTLGASVDLTLRPQFALVMGYERSGHDVSFDNGRRSLPSTLQLLTFGLAYRIDLTPVVPYLGGSGQLRWLRMAPSDDTQDWALSFSAGLLIPFARYLFVGAEARYGVYAGSDLGNARTYLLRLGVRSGD